MKDIMILLSFIWSGIKNSFAPSKMLQTIKEYRPGFNYGTLFILCTLVFTAVLIFSPETPSFLVALLFYLFLIGGFFWRLD